jgi:hypothetical protein
VGAAQHVHAPTSSPKAAQYHAQYLPSRGGVVIVEQRLIASAGLVIPVLGLAPRAACCVMRGV